MNAAADLVERSVQETLTYYAFPDIHWQKIRTNNPLERIMREIRRRTRVVGAFPDGQSCLNLAAARLRYIAGSAWSTKRYMNMRPLYQPKVMQTGAVADQCAKEFGRQPIATSAVMSGCNRSVGDAPILLQKSPSRLCEIEICNDRIGARASLNCCCAFAPDFESMLRDKMLKIFLQHNLPTADVSQSYSITSLAILSSDGGNSRPRALAVFRFRASSNLVGSWTGRSAGRAPLNILSTYRAALR